MRLFQFVRTAATWRVSSDGCCLACLARSSRKSRPGSQSYGLRGLHQGVTPYTSEIMSQSVNL